MIRLFRFLVTGDWQMSRMRGHTLPSRPKPFMAMRSQPIEEEEPPMIDQQPLTEAQIDEVFDTMPGGADGFLKSWGYLKFAQAIADKAARAERSACARVVDRHFSEFRDLMGEDLAQKIRARGTGGEEPGKNVCSWYSGNYGGWHSSCGTAYIFESGGPVENGHKFCHCCGKRLTVTEAKDTNGNP